MEEVIRTIRIDATANTQGAERSLSRLRDTLRGINGSQSSASRAAKGHSSALKNLSKVTKAAHKHSLLLFDTLKRVVMYRALRAAIKAIVQGFREGLENAYWFSKGINGDLAKALDGLAVKSQTMKNQLGAAFGGLLQTIMPIIQQIISWINALASALTRVFAMFGGRGTYLKAVDASAQFAENTKSGAGSAKKMKDYLMGIDELNVISDPNSGGGGGGSSIPDYSSMFEEAELPDWMKGIQDLMNADMFKSAGARFADYLNGVIADWDSGKWGKELGEKIENALEFAWGFLYGKNTTGTGFSFENVGIKLQLMLNGILKEINPEILGGVLVGKIYALIELAKGFLEGFSATETGKWLGNLIMGAVNKIPWSDASFVVSQGIIDIVDTIATMVETADWEKVGEDIAEFIRGLNIAGITDAFIHLASASITGLGSLIVGLFKEEWKDVTQWWNDTAFEDGKFSMTRFLEGILDVILHLDDWLEEHCRQPINDAINKAFGVDSKTAQEMRKAGQTLPSDLIMGMNTALFAPLDLLKMVTGISKATNDEIDIEKGQFEKSGEKILGHIKNGWMFMVDPFKGLGKLISDGVNEQVNDSTTKSNLENSGKGIINSIWEGLKSAWNSVKQWWDNLPIWKKNKQATGLGAAVEQTENTQLLTFAIDSDNVISAATEAGVQARNAFNTAFYSGEDEGFFTGLALEFQQVGEMMSQNAPIYAGDVEVAFTDAIQNIWDYYDSASSAIWGDITFYFGEKLREGILHMTGLFKSQMMDCAGVARQEIGAVREALDKLNGYTVHVYIKVHVQGAAIDTSSVTGGIGGLAHGGIIKAADGLQMPSRGQLFVAREQGPELVSGIGNGQTAVMNNNQIVESVSSGVRDALLDAMSMNTNSSDDRPIVVEIDGREIARATRQGNKSNGFTLSSNPTFA